MSQGERLIEMKVLVVNDELTAASAVGRTVRALARSLGERDMLVIEATSVEDAKAVLLSDPSVQAILLSWSLGKHDTTHQDAQELLALIRSRNADVPVFLMADKDGAALNAEVMRQVDELIWFLEDTTSFIAGRVLAAVLRYREAIAPPFTKALIAFAQKYEYSWHTPGHAGGTAFLKSPVGRAFHEYFGENLLRSDLSISVGELGSLLDHSGPIGESEKFCARIFGADRSYTVTNGSSMSNRVIMMSSVTRGDYALCDRNAHKSTEQALTMTGVVPTYLVPSRNHLGIIGPIYAQRLTEAAIKAAIQANPLALDKTRKAVHAIVTNSTYDGLIYLVPRVVELLDASIDRIHFDEAWYGYARFNPLYRNRFGMYGEAKDYPRDKPTIFTTTSTHKLLAAISQSSLISVRDGRNPVPHARFNESYMMHGSTSPLYTIIASNEVSAAMMSGVGGRTLDDRIDQGSSRVPQGRAQHQARRREERRLVLQHLECRHGDRPGGEEVIRVRGRAGRAADQRAGLLGAAPGRTHGTASRTSRTATACSTRSRSRSCRQGLPWTARSRAAASRPSWSRPSSSRRGIQVEKTTDFTILVLFSLGVTRGKFGTLVNALLRFKEAYDANTPVAEVLFEHAADTPAAYAGVGLKDLADAMFAQMKATDILRLQAAAFSSLPVPVMTPAEAYSKLVHNEIEEVADRPARRPRARHGVVPYPPGIPMLMPGENAGDAAGPFIGYLRGLQAWGQRFPGFGHDTHGVEDKGGVYYVQCSK